MPDSPADSAPNRILDGKYEIQRTLGAGGMGEIFLARHIHLEHQRVIKVLKPELAEEPEAQKRFLREARLATQIKHPNVSILYDYSRLPEGRFYMVWEYIEGLDVGRYLEQRGPFTLPDGVRLAIQALRGLGAIHAAGVIHRDISPDNLMLTRDARGHLLLKIIDLGLAKALEPEPDYEVTQAGMFMGKLQYCSPEQAGLLQGETQLDSRSDLYSFGLVLYEMLTGQLPYPSDGTPGAVFKRVDESPIPLSQRGIEGVPASLDGILLRTLSKDRDQRFISAVELIEALEGTLTELGVRRPRRPAGSARPRVEQEALLGDLGAAFASTALPGDGSGAQPQSSDSATRPITRQERQVLLAQIDRAAKKVKEVSRLYDLAEEAIDAGRFDDARRLLTDLERTSPSAPGLQQLRRRLEARGGAALAAKPVAGATTTPVPILAGGPIAEDESEGLEGLDLDSDLDLAFPSLGEDSSEVLPPIGHDPSLGIGNRESSSPPAAALPVAVPQEGPGKEVLPPVDPLPTVSVTPASSGPLPQTQKSVPAPPAGPVADPPQHIERTPDPSKELAQVQELEAEAAPASRAERVREAERMVQSALAKGNKALAKLALSTLLELAPEHAKKEEYESWIEMVGQEAKQRKKAEDALEQGRGAIGAGDFRGARKQLDLLRRLEAVDLAERLEVELTTARQSQTNTQEFDLRSVRFDVALEDGNLAAAEQQLRSMESLGLAKVTLDGYRSRLATSVAEQREATVVEPLEVQFRARLGEGAFEPARAVARELAELLPGSATPGRWLAEVAEREQNQQRRRSVLTGVSQVEEFLDAGDAVNAEMGLRILKQLAPDDDRWPALERRLAALKG